MNGELQVQLLVHLVRHGETASYGHDAGLTDRGRTQVRDRGRELVGSIGDGEPIAFGCAPTERARLTAELLRDTIGRGGPVAPEPGYRNVQVCVDGTPREPTQVRARFDAEIAAGATELPGWVVEAQRFWRAHEEAGDAMGFWLSTPMLWHESPASVVGRTLRTTVEKVDAGARGRLVIGTHSGVLRAIVHWAGGADPGEPENAEEVVIGAVAGSDRVTISYRGREWSMQIPGIEPDWKKV